MKDDDGWMEHWAFELSRWLLSDHDGPVIAHPVTIRKAESLVKTHDRAKCIYCRIDDDTPSIALPSGGNGGRDDT